MKGCIHPSVTSIVDETGERYFRVGPFGCWESESDQKKFREAELSREEARRKKRNENRVARGQRKKSPSQFCRSSARFDEYRRADTGLTFKEWLRCRRCI